MVDALRDGSVDHSDVSRRIGDELLEAIDAPPPEPSRLRAKVLATAPGQRLRTFVLDRRDPRKLGEVHRWMYDHLDLVALLRRQGFADAAPTTHDVSRIRGWQRYRRTPRPTAHGPASPIPCSSRRRWDDGRRHGAWHSGSPGAPDHPPRL